MDKKLDSKEVKSEFWTAVGKLFPNRLKLFSLKIRRLERNVLGCIEPKNGKLVVTLDVKKHKRMDSMRTTILHELAHAVLDYGMKPKACAASKEKTTLEELDEPFTDLYALRLGRKLKRDFTLRYPKRQILGIIEKNASNAKRLVRRTYALYRL